MNALFACEAGSRLKPMAHGPARQDKESDYEGTQLAPLAEEPAPGLPRRAPQRPRVRDQ